MFINGEITEDEKLSAERLVDAFNRNAWRAAFYISSLINTSTDYPSWSKEFFNDFYNNGSKLKGYSEKAIACFLQQGFLNPEAIPIDTWVKTFYEYPLGIHDNKTFFESFSSLGKLERLIWLSSQSNKTNMRSFFDILWCQRYGTIGNGKLRGINPIACYGCKLKETCVGANNSKSKQVYLAETTSNVTPETIFNSNPNIDYVVTLNNRIPEKCYISKKTRGSNHLSAILIDEFSAYIFNSSNAVDNIFIQNKIISFEDFVF